MRSPDGWAWERPSKSLILVILLFFIIISTHTCQATEFQNMTLSEVTSYNFTKGYYNVVTFAENDEANFRIMHETDIPYLNITYKAPSDGYLDIYLIPLEGPVPYIELGEGWEIKSLTYSKNLEKNEATNFLLSPPMIFWSSNFSRVVGEDITLWELYKWPDLSGLINYTFTTTDEISFDLIWYPINPRQGERISLFTESNAKIVNITWTISGEGIDWENNSEVLEINSLDEGTYTVFVRGYDEFNNSHSVGSQIIIRPPVFEQAYFDLSLFSIDYPDSVNLGDLFSLKATVDYFLPDSTDIKLLIQNTVNGENYTDTSYTLNGNGSIQFTSNLEAQESGVMNFNLRLFYSDGDDWVELDEASRAFSIIVNEYDGPHVMPTFSLVSLSIGLILVLTVNLLRSREKNELAII
jgi:hypothetical protein